MIIPEISIKEFNQLLADGILLVKHSYIVATTPKEYVLIHTPSGSSWTGNDLPSLIRRAINPSEHLNNYVVINKNQF
jgi:hypothetical protein